jgi:ABC-type antimicrobial peptide transport system permease subunit
MYDLKTIFRSLSRNGTYSVINIAGLSIGLTVVLLISLQILNERSFDRSFSESRNIYRINSVLTKYMPGETYCATNNFVGPEIKEVVPDVLTTVRIYSRSYVTKINENSLQIRIIWADKDFFHLFNTTFLQGSHEIAMSRPNVVVISESMANKLFGNTQPIGKTFLLDNQHQVEVSAVYKDFPANSSVREFHIIAPYPYLYPASRLRQNIDWEDTDFETFCLLASKADTVVVGAEIRNAVSSFMGDEAFFVPSLQKLTDIHLHSSGFRPAATSTSGSIEKVRTLSLLAIIILLVACFNYTNLSTARAQKRSKEIGVCKTFGASRSKLIVKLVLETAILTLIALLISFMIFFYLRPIYNNLFGEDLEFEMAISPIFLLIAFLIWIITTILASLYPALYLSGFPPLKTIRLIHSSGKSSHVTVRKILSMSQFAVSVVLIVWAIIIQSQLSYISSKDIGFNPSNLIAIRTSLPEGADTKALLNDYLSQSTVIMGSRSHKFIFNGSRSILKKDIEDKIGSRLITLCVDHGGRRIIKKRFIAGEPLPERNTGNITQMIINRKAAEYLGKSPEEIIGKTILAEISEAPVEVCGVVENFNYESLHNPVEPYGLYNGMRERSVIMLRVEKGDIMQQLEKYEQIFKTHFPGELFDVVFPDLELEKYYTAERRTGHIVAFFSLMAIFVACLGVFGLTVFMAEQRTKEIGIRKVIGASLFDILSLFTDNYIKMLSISLFIAIPIAWYVGNQYLQNFAFRIPLAWWIFAFAALITIATTLLTVTAQAIKAATTNPIKAIKSE